MNPETELAELLHTASGAFGPRTEPDPDLLMSGARHARRRRRTLGLTLAAASLLLVGGLTIPSALDRNHGGVDLAAGGPTGLPAGWTKLPTPPLSPRIGAVAATVGDQVVVIGGTDHLCPAGAPCPPFPHRADGAAFNLATRTWHRIADAPEPVANSTAVVVGSDVYLAVAPADTRRQCTPPEDFCVAAPRPRPNLLRYRVATDAWDSVAGPPANASSELVAVGDDLVAYASVRSTGASDWRLPAGSGTWVQLPPDPLPGITERHMVADGPDLVLFGPEDLHGAKTIHAPGILGARLHLGTGTWSDLPPIPGPAEQIWAVDGTLVAEGRHLVGGWLLSADGWAPMPPPPPASADGVVVGAVGATAAAFAAPTGWVLDLSAQAWLKLPPFGGDFAPAQPTITSAGRHLFLFGGERVTSMSYVLPPPPELLSDAWVWTPPDTGRLLPVRPTPSEVPQPVSGAPTAPVLPPPATATTPQTASSVAPPAPGAPVLLSATGDASAGRVTLHYDRPVVPGDGPTSFTLPPGYMTAMNLIVFGADRGCSMPQGNAHAYLSGVGTDTITVEATSLVPGTSYIAVGPGVFKSAQGGIPNVTTGCTAIPVSGTVPTMPTTTVAKNAPELLSATGDSAAGRITLHFNRPVVPGDGPNLNRPPNTPPLSDPSLVAMQLVVYMTDASCTHPNGNAHQYLSGVGTDTVTVEATSLVSGTTYISANGGFVKGVGDGAALKPTGCRAILVT